MKTDKINPAWLWLVMIVFVLLNSACSAQALTTALPAELKSIPPSSTPAQPTLTLPPPTSTPAPAAAPVSGQLSYLPSPADLPPSFEWSLSWEGPHMFDPLTVLDYAQTRFYSHAGWFYAEVRIATTPYEKGAKDMQLGGTGTLVDSPPVGKFSEAYVTNNDPPRVEFSFVKGNILVVFRGPITVDEAVKLAQVLEQRIPENLTELAPITFPDKLDPVAAAKFGNFMLGKCTPDNTVAAPMTVFSTKENLENCLQMDWAAQDPNNNRKLEYAIYDLQNQEYMLKYSSAHGFGQLFFPGLAGNYEMRVALDDVLIAVLPFEMR